MKVSSRNWGILLIVHCNVQGWGTFEARFSESLQLQAIILPSQTRRIVQTDANKKDMTAKNILQQKFEDFINSYFEGDLSPELSLALDMDQYTGFERKVLNSLLRIKPGTTMSYASLAEYVGHKKAWRAVGNVMHKNRFPLYFPCHRVLSSSGKIGGFSAGLEMKRRLLAFEKNITG